MTDLEALWSMHVTLSVEMVPLAVDCHRPGHFEKTFCDLQACSRDTCNVYLAAYSYSCSMATQPTQHCQLSAQRTSLMWGYRGVMWGPSTGWYPRTANGNSKWRNCNRHYSSAEAELTSWRIEQRNWPVCRRRRRWNRYCVERQRTGGHERLNLWRADGREPRNIEVKR